MRNLLKKLTERFLNCGEVGVDVGMVEFYVIENDQFREILEKLAAFIGEGGVVLVSLQHPKGSGTVMAAGGEIEGDSSDKPARVELSFFEKKGEHSGGGGFAVSA